MNIDTTTQLVITLSTEGLDYDAISSEIVDRLSEHLDDLQEDVAGLEGVQMTRDEVEP